VRRAFARPARLTTLVRRLAVLGERLTALVERLARAGRRLRAGRLTIFRARVFRRRAAGRFERLAGFLGAIDVSPRASVDFNSLSTG